LVARPGAARLKGDRDPTAVAQHASQLAERLGRLVPELQRVDGQNLVERHLERRRALDGPEPQLDPPASHGLGVAPYGYSHHDLGVVEPAHIAVTARRASSRIAIPGPNPISSTRSSRCTSSSETAQALRRRFDERWAMTQPAIRPGRPVGRPN
jgi:hypothetical protein